VRIVPVATSTIWIWPSGSPNAIRLPSGDHAACIAAPASRVSWRSAPLSSSRTHRFIEPPRSDVYAIDLPSGDQAGSASTHASWVSRRAVPLTGIVHRSPSATKATCAPSGATTGCTMPCAICGPARLKFFRFGVKLGRVNEMSAVNSMTRVGPPVAARRLIFPSEV